MKRALSYIVIVTLFATMWVGVANVEAKTIKKAGWYYSDLRKDLGTDKEDEGYTYAKKIKLNKNKLIVKGTVGTISLKKTTIKKKKYTVILFRGVKYKAGNNQFKISKKCKCYRAKDAESKSKKISFKKLKKLSSSLKKGSSKDYYRLNWKVKGGKIVRMEIYTY